MMNHHSPGCEVCRACSSSILSGFGDQDLKSIDEQKTWHTAKKGDYIFKEGNLPLGIFCVYDGNVKISKTDEDGKEQIVRLAKRGSFIGYRALLCNDIYHASAIALDEVHYCFFKKETYLNWLYSNPKIAAETIQILTNDLRFAENMMMNIAQKHARGRIAEIILILEEFYGVYEKDGTINTCFRREDIGHLAGTTTETTIRILSEFAKDGIIAAIGKKIKIINRNKLNELSNRYEVITKR